MVPPQLHGKVVALANDVRVAVDQTGNDPLATQVDHLGPRVLQAKNIGIRADLKHQTVLQRHRARFRPIRIHRRDLAVE